MYRSATPWGYHYHWYMLNMMLVTTSSKLVPVLVTLPVTPQVTPRVALLVTALVMPHQLQEAVQPEISSTAKAAAMQPKSRRQGTLYWW
jgi:hypothetical protein